MRLPRRLIAVAFVVAAAAGCSNGGDGTLVAPPPSGSTAPETTTTTSSAPPTSFVPAASPARLSAACPLLDAAEIARALTNGDTYDSSEESPTTENGLTSYTCEYHRSDEPSYEWASLTVLAAPGNPSQKTALQVSTQECADKPQTLSEAAVYCTNTDNGTDITVAKPSHGETRVVLLSLTLRPSDASRDGYASLAKTVAGRL
ncbi:hypothetical protein [Amycolatopsis sp. NPDC001319]|uniref:hypothetical protein n=1 Tax=unclassified Amycolatopsis TaxID=2618356 RepID=UPI0036C74B95